MSSALSIEVIILYYKEFDYFCESLTSVLAQDHKDFSVLVIDDASKDERLERYISSKDDSRIKLVTNSKNIGLAKNFELARSLSSAEFVIFLGQDDVLENNYISTVLPWISQDNSIAIVQPKVSVMDEHGKKFLPLADLVKSSLTKLAWELGEKQNKGTTPGSLLSSRKAAAVLLLGDFLYFPTLTWKSSLMKSFDVSREVTLDYQMIMDVLRKDGQLLLLSKDCARYRRHSRSASMKPERMIQRLYEERSFHYSLRKHDLLSNSLILRLLNALRISHRLHALQMSMSYLTVREWSNSLLALRCMLMSERRSSNVS
jgi:glycosyltransferase involved in cell wall biosynthesis